MMNNTKSYLAERLEKEKEVKTDSFQGSYLAQAMKNHNVPTSDVIKANNQFVNTITGIQNEYAETYGQSALKDYQASRALENEIKSSPEFNNIKPSYYDKNASTNDNFGVYLKDGRFNVVTGYYMNEHNREKLGADWAFRGNSATTDYEDLTARLVGYMTDDEKKTYNYLFFNGRYDEADKYITGLIPHLQEKAYAESEAEKLANIAENGNSAVGVLHNIAPGMINSINYGIHNIGQAISNAFTGEDRKVSTLGQAGIAMLENQAHNMAAKRDASPLGEFLIDTGISIGQNAMLAPLAAAPGGKAVIVGILSSSAAGNVMYQKMLEGASAQEAANYGIAAGIIEALTERISWKSLDNIIKGAAKSGIKGSAKEIFGKIGMALAIQGGTEGAEEGLSALGNLAFDEAYSAIFKGEGGEVSDYYHELIEQGKTPDEAILETFGKFGADVLLAVAGGFLSGGVMGSGGTVIGSITNKWRNASNDKNKPSDTTTSKEKLDEMVAGGEITQEESNILKNPAGLIKNQFTQDYFNDEYQDRLNTIANKLGVRLQFEDMANTTQSKLHNGILTINTTLLNTTGDMDASYYDAVNKVVSNQITSAMKDTATEQYNEMFDIAAQTNDFKNRVSEYVDEGLTVEEAEHSALCDWLSQIMFKSEDTFRIRNLMVEKPTLASKIKAFFDSICAQIKSALGNLPVPLAKLQKTWEDALKAIINTDSQAFTQRTYEQNVTTNELDTREKLKLAPVELADLRSEAIANENELARIALEQGEDVGFNRNDIDAGLVNQEVSEPVDVEDSGGTNRRYNVDKYKELQKGPERTRATIETISEHSDSAAAREMARNIAGGPGGKYQSISNKDNIEQAKKMLNTADVGGGVSGITQVMNTVRNAAKMLMPVDSTTATAAMMIIENGRNYFESEESYRRFCKDFAVTMTEAGRTVQVMSVFANQALQLAGISTGAASGEICAEYMQGVVDKLNATIEDKNVQDRHKLKPKEGEKFKLDGELVKQLKNAETSEARVEKMNEIYQNIADQVKRTPYNMFNSFTISNMLLSVASAMRNTFGNAGLFLRREANNIILMGLQKSKLAKKLGSDYVSAVGLTKRDAKLLEFAEYDYETNVAETIKNSSKFGEERNAITNRVSNFKNPIAQFLWGGGGVKFLLEKGPTGDAPWLRLGYKRNFARALKASGLSYDDLTRGEKMTSQQKATLNKCRALAVAQTRQQTLKATNKFIEIINKAAYSADSPIWEIGLNVISPFRSTQANITVENARSSPIGFLMFLANAATDKRLSDGLTNHSMETLASAIGGTAVLLSGVLLGGLGIVRTTGGDKEEDQFERYAEGKVNYTIQIGDVSFDIDWASPFVPTLMVGAEISNAFADISNNEFSPEEIFDMIARMTSVYEKEGIMTSFADMSDAMQGDQYSDNTSNSIIANLASSSIINYTGRLIPGWVSDIAYTIDPKRRTPYTQGADEWEVAWNKIKSKVPFASQTLPEYTDRYGRTEEKETAGDYIWAFFENFVSLSYINKTTEDATTKAVKELYRETGKASVFPSFFNGEVKYENEDGSYTVYSPTTGEYERLKRLAGNSTYNYSKSAFEHKGFSSLPPTVQADMLSDLYSYSNDKAIHTVFPDAHITSTNEKILSAEKAGVAPMDYLICRYKINSEKASLARKREIVTEMFTGAQRRAMYIALDID